jgi:hypothetical protein
VAASLAPAAPVLDGADAPAAPSSRRGDVIATTVIAAVCCAAIVAYWFGMVVTAPGPQDPAERGQLISAMYDPPQNAVENALVKGDGQLFAGQATDPLAQRTDLVRGGPDEEAYRYQRPLYGWLGWIASGGQPGAVAWGLIIVTLASVVLLVAATASWLDARGADPRWALALVATPGVFVDLTWVGPEALGTALLGLARWLRPDRPGPVDPAGVAGTRPDLVAIALFAAAGLCRETLLVVPFVLMVTAALKGRRAHAVAAALTAVPYLAWVAYLYVQIGALPKGSVEGRMSMVPLGGLVAEIGGWGPGDLVFAAVLVGVAVAAFVLGRDSGLRPILGAQLALATLLGAPVWHRFPDFGRVLLPLSVLSLLALVPALAARRAAAAEPADGSVSHEAVHPAT